MLLPKARQATQCYPSYKIYCHHITYAQREKRKKQPSLTCQILLKNKIVNIYSKMKKMAAEQKYPEMKSTFVLIASQSSGTYQILVCIK